MAVARSFPNLNFRRLTGLVQPDDGQDVLYVTEQKGLIRTFPNRQDAAESTIFLDITGRVNEGGNEEGLLGLAFDPSYQDNGFFYVYYSAKDPRHSVLSRFSVNPSDPSKADPDSESIILEIPQPFKNHNGGQIALGPDGYLYIGLGDGGSGGDPLLNGQNTTTLLGSLLRIDVSTQDGYQIPADNPFLSVAGAKPEIWAYGLRNPWRFSFDRETGDLWLGDVGQNLWEEINLVKKGRNYGWNAMEGVHCFRPKSGCDGTGLELPIVEYSSNEGCSVIGGYVYRGAGMPSISGAYLYGDFCRGTVWGLRYDGDKVTEHILLAKVDARITSFGEDQAGNVYILSRDDGIYQLASRE
jgi:glucose/arabinose dehydrogenase